MWKPSVLLLTVFITQGYSAPQFITFNEGKLGVNFGGYHAAVGLGGLLGGNGKAGGGLFAEAGTPFGQGARAGLGGSLDAEGGSSGGLYAGATAGGDIKAEAGLGGKIAANGPSGAGFASASSGAHYASADLGGATVIKETEVAAIPVEKLRKKVYSKVKYEATNEIAPAVTADVDAKVHIKSEAQPTVIVKEVSKRRSPRHTSKHFPLYSQLVVPQAKLSGPSWLTPAQYIYVKEVYVQPPPTTKVIEKTIIRAHKPHRHHFRKTAYIGGYIGADAGAAVAQPAVQSIERRADIGVEGEVHAAAGANVNANSGHGSEVTYTKKISVQRNPTFFQDIFNIPISTLKAVNSFLTNAAGSTKVSIEKSAAVHTESDATSSKHVPVSKSSSSSSEAHISVQTPSASKLLDDIFSIPINTLSAVNTFLENNAARKQIQVSGEVSNEPTRVRLGPHARRRANKQVIVVQEPSKSDSSIQD